MGRFDPGPAATLNSFHGPSPLRRDHQRRQTARLSDCRGGLVVDIDSLPGSPRFPLRKRTGRHSPANATLKAVYYSRFAPGQLVLADDSGLEVDALQGAPGVRSARFAADLAWWTRRTPMTTPTCGTTWCCCNSWPVWPPRSAPPRYHCALVAARDGLPFHTAYGTVEGLILEGREGRAGSATTRFFICPSSTAPWRKSISKPNSQ